MTTGSGTEPIRSIGLCVLMVWLSVGPGSLLDAADPPGWTSFLLGLVILELLHSLFNIYCAGAEAALFSLRACRATAQTKPDSSRAMAVHTCTLSLFRLLKCRYLPQRRF